jgi:hypothetical protein
VDGRQSCPSQLIHATRLTFTIDQQVSVSYVQARDYQQNQSGGRAVMSITADPASRLTSTIDQQVFESLVQARDYQQNQQGGKAVMSITVDPASRITSIIDQQVFYPQL